MKIIKTLVVGCLFLFAIVQAETQYPKTITFAEQTYFHAFEGENSSKNVFVVEYLPQGEALETFNQMVTYSELKMVKAKDIEAYFSTMAKDTTQPFFSKTYYSGKDASRGEYYLIKMGISGDMTEYMIFRFMVKDDHVAYYLYSDRSYHGLTDEWMDKVTREGKQWLNDIRELEI